MISVLEFDESIESVVDLILQEDNTSGVTPTVTVHRCSVCDKPVSKKRDHYGSNACTSCRAFFRRSVQSNETNEFECLGDGDCRIDSTSWKSCRKCRFQKCIKSGMNPNWVMDERQREERELVRKRNKKAPSRSLELKLTVEEVKMLGEMNRDHVQHCVDKHLLYLGVRKNVFRSFVYNSLYGTPYTNRLYVENSQIISAVHFMYWLDHVDMLKINEDDRFALVRANLPKLQQFSTAIDLHLKDRSKFAQHYLSAIWTSPRNEDWVSRVLRKELMAMNLEESACLRRLDDQQHQQTDPLAIYERVYASPWAANSRLEDRHRELVSKISLWCRRSKQETKDDTLVLLLQLIVMFSADSVAVADKERVEKMRDKYLMMLFRYLKDKFGTKASQKLTDGLICMSMLEELTDIVQMRLRL